MNKLRQIMKAFYFANNAIDIHLKINQLDLPGFVKEALIESQKATLIHQVRNTPASVFHLHKPEIDKRRARRHFRKQKLSGIILRPNNDE